MQGPQSFDLEVAGEISSTRGLFDGKKPITAAVTAACGGLRNAREQTSQSRSTMIWVNHPGAKKRRPHPRVYLGAIAVSAVLMGTLGSANAMASPTRPASAAALGAAANGTASGTVAACPSKYKSHVQKGSAGYTEVKWTNNPCHLKIEDRTWCESLLTPGDAKWVDSGIVKKTGVWAKARCAIFWTPARGEERHTGANGSWGKWHSYWS